MDSLERMHSLYSVVMMRVDIWTGHFFVHGVPLEILVSLAPRDLHVEVHVAYVELGHNDLRVRMRVDLSLVSSLLICP